MCQVGFSVIPRLAKCDFWGNLLWACSWWPDKLEVQILSTFDFVYSSFGFFPWCPWIEICCCSFESRWYQDSISVVPKFAIVVLSLGDTKFPSSCYQDLLVWLWLLVVLSSRIGGTKCFSINCHCGDVCDLLLGSVGPLQPHYLSKFVQGTLEVILGGIDWVLGREKNFPPVANSVLQLSELGQGYSTLTDFVIHIVLTHRRYRSECRVCQPT